MPDVMPDPAELQRAIDIYIRLAYPGDPPIVVRSQLGTLKSWTGRLTECPVLTPYPPKAATRYSLRLGNASYPHMKLTLDLSGDRKQFLYVVNTHDRHISPATNSPEFPAFQKLMETNQKLAEAIEAAWERAGIMTFKAYLRNDLQRRRAQST
jgi:hypothetical protein